MKQKETLNRDNLIVQIIRGCVGKENAINGKDLARILTEKGYPTKHDYIHDIVSNLIKERFLPICSLSHKGYYFPKNKQDIEIAIEQLQSKANEYLNRIEFLKSFIF